jgi:chromosome transmission fidelity protein 18
MFLKRSAHQEVADGIAKALPMHIKSLFTGANVVAELAPLLMRIVTPDLRPVWKQVLAYLFQLD